MIRQDKKPGKIVEITFPGEFTDLNTYIHSLNASRYGGNTIKGDETKRAWADCFSSGVKRINFRPFIIFKWYVRDRKKDKDNISFAKKFILDGIRDAKVLRNDGWNDILGFMDTFALEKEFPEVHVYLIEKPENIRIVDYLDKTG